MDIQNGGHIDALLKLNAYFQNRVTHSDYMVFSAIVKADSRTLGKFIANHRIGMNLISDEQGITGKYFGYECGQCLRIILTDRQSKLRYDSPLLDTYMIDRLTDRYASDSLED